MINVKGVGTAAMFLEQFVFRVRESTSALGGIKKYKSEVLEQGTL